MNRFNFPLERVERWRRGQADLEQLKLRQLLAELEATEQRKRQLQAERVQADAVVLAQATASAEDLSRLDSFRHYVQAQSRALDQILRQQGEKVAGQRERAIEARRRYELLDKLQHKALLEWQAAFNKEQEDMASELHLAKINRES